MENQSGMENGPIHNFNNQIIPRKLPNATAVLILGIVSIVACCCYGIVGIITSIIGLVLASKDKKLYLENPDTYTDYNNLNTGRILCIIGLILSILYLVVIIAYLIMVFLGIINEEFLETFLSEMEKNNY